jgi:phosphate transport system substrate-binding protein
MLRQMFTGILVLILFVAAGCGTGAEITTGDRLSKDLPKKRLLIGGSGSNLALTKKMADRYMALNPEVDVIIPSSMGSGGGIKKTAEGILDIGLVSRNIYPDEERYKLIKIPYARVAVVMSVHSGVKISGLTSEQIVAVYSGKIRNWQEVGGEDVPIKVLTREIGDSGRIILNKHIKGFAAIKESPGGILFRTDQTMNEAIQSIPNAIGWTDMGVIRTEHLNVKPIAIDGLLPTEEMIQKGKYPFIKELFFVVKGQPEGEVKKFIDFALSWEGKKIIVENGYLLARP